MADDRLHLEAVWDDPDLIELRADVWFGGWAGRALAYVTRRELAQFAADLDAVAAGATGAHLAGGQPEFGVADLRVYEYGLARRVGVAVQLALPASRQPDGPCSDSELKMAAPAERGALAGFAAGLRAVARDSTGSATLPLLTGWP